MEVLHEDDLALCGESVNEVVVSPFLTNVPISYPLKTPGKQRFSDVFRGYKMGTLARYGLSITKGRPH